MPLFVVYPAKPAVLKLLFDVLGEPKGVEVGVSVRDEVLRELLKLDDVDRLTIQCYLRPTAERALELYREYYESYVGVVKMERPHVKEEPRAVSSFKASWCIDGLSAEFDGFKLKIRVRGNVEKATEIAQLLKERDISVEIDLSDMESS